MNDFLQTQDRLRNDQDARSVEFVQEDVRYDSPAAFWIVHRFSKEHRSLEESAETTSLRWILSSE